jgi:hypothetical protein
MVAVRRHGKLRAVMREHLLGVIAGRFFSSTVVSPGPTGREQHGGLQLRDAAGGS